MEGPNQVFGSRDQMFPICLAVWQSSLCRGWDYKVCVVNTADKKVLPKQIETAIKTIDSLRICEISPSETYLTVTGRFPSYSENKTDVFDISKLQELSFAEKIFSKPELHIDSIHQQFKNTSPWKKQSVNC
jgi:hypothetical protein